MSLKTLKYGELYLLGDGSQHRLISSTVGVGSDMTGFVHNGTWSLVNNTGDISRRTGNHILSQTYAGSFSTVLNLTHGIVRPIFYSDGTNVHIWYAYDGTGGSTYSIYHAYSADGGATWSTPGAVIVPGAGGSWNELDVFPCGIHYVDANTTYLFVVGVNGSNVFTVGRYTIDTSGGGGLAAEYANAANYSQYGSNPVTASTAERYVSIVHDGAAYQMWHGTTSTATVIYHNSSSSGLVWPASLTERPVLRLGVNTTLDDTSMRLGAAFYHSGFYYVPYRGNDGSSNYGMIAIGQRPDRLIKVGNLQTLASYARVRFAADLTFEASPQAVHVPERGRCGVLLDATFEPFNLSFTFKQDVIGGSDGIKVGASAEAGDNVWQYLLLANPSVRESQGETMSVPSVNILYRLDTDAAGTLGEWFLFLDCTPVSVQVSEAAEGNTVTATYRCNGGNLPLAGRY